MRDLPLRIGLIGSVRFPQRPPFAGGLEAHTWMLAEGLRDRGLGGLAQGAELANKDIIKGVFDGLTANRRNCITCGYTEAVMHFAFDNWQLAVPRQQVCLGHALMHPVTHRRRRFAGWRNALRTTHVSRCLRIAYAVSARWSQHTSD